MVRLASLALTNWAENYHFSARRLARPSSIRELQDLVRQSPSVKAIGTRHSFNDIADSPDTLISLDGIPGGIQLDRENSRVNCHCGITYGKLAKELQREGYALENMASLPHIAVAGACATATHGSGINLANLAGAVVGIDLVLASGDVEALTPESHPDTFYGAVVGLGALGIALTMKLRVVPTYDISQFVYERLPFTELFRNFDAVIGAGYSVSLFTNWSEPVCEQVWVKALSSQFAPTKEFYGGTLADGPRTPVPGGDPGNCTPQQGEAGPWHERLPHFRMDFLPSSGEELQSEFFVRHEDAIEAMKVIAALGPLISPHLHLSEIRSVAGDALWMSPAYKRKSIAIHFTWRRDTAAVMALLPTIEKALEPFDARPHWGKLFTIPAERLTHLYPRKRDFEGLMRRYDPSGKFRNRFIEKIFP